MGSASTTSRASALVLGVVIAMLSASPQDALATFRYDLRFDDNTHLKLLTPGDFGKSVTLGLWAQIKSSDGTFSNDSPSADVLSIVSSSSDGGAMAGGGVTGVSLYNGGPDQLGWDKAGETFTGSAINLSHDGVADWGGFGNDPTTGYIRYKPTKATTGGYFAFPPDQNLTSLLPADASHLVAGTTDTWEWKLATITIRILGIGTTGSTTFLPVSQNFTGINVSYDLAYFNDTRDLGNSTSGALVSKSQLPSLGVSFVVDLPEPSVLLLPAFGALLALRRSRTDHHVVDQPR